MARLFCLLVVVISPVFQRGLASPLVPLEEGGGENVAARQRRGVLRCDGSSRHRSSPQVEVEGTLPLLTSSHVQAESALFDDVIHWLSEHYYGVVLYLDVSPHCIWTQERFNDSGNVPLSWNHNYCNEEEESSIGAAVGHRESSWTAPIKDVKHQASIDPTADTCAARGIWQQPPTDFMADLLSGTASAEQIWCLEGYLLRLLLGCSDPWARYSLSLMWAAVYRGTTGQRVGPHYFTELSYAVKVRQKMWMCERPSPLWKAYQRQRDRLSHEMHCWDFFINRLFRMRAFLHNPADVLTYGLGDEHECAAYASN
jgi:hypothetical protein